MKRLRLVLLLVSLPVGCVDEDTNSATGSFVDVAGLAIEDVDGGDGVLVDCSSLVSSNVSIVDGAVEVSVSFPAGTAAGARLELPGSATVTVRSGSTFDVQSGVVIVDTNDIGADIRIAVTLENVTASDGRVVSGSIDCLETTGDSIASSCASAGDGDGGGGGGGDFDD